jgi:hypothetical protein
MSRHIFAILIVSLLLAACCPMLSVNPLSEPASLDKRLSGLWLYDSEDDKVYLHVGELSKNTMVAFFVEHKQNDQLDIGKIPFFLTKTNVNKYLNIRIEETELSEGHKGHIFMRYVFMDNNTLLVSGLDRQQIASAIRSKKLKGIITYKKPVKRKKQPSRSSPSEPKIDCIKITDNSKNVLEFLETNDPKKLFPKTMKFVRINEYRKRR